MISRRRFLQVTGAAIATSTTLAACGDGGASSGGAKASG
jgi:putative aldouronate transport system substrate-binding protein